MRRLVALALLAVVAATVLLRRRRRRAVPPAPPAGPPPAAAPSAEPDSGYVSVPWTLAAEPGERAELTLRCHQDDALVLDRADAQETPTQVFVTALARRQPRGAGEPPRRPAEAQVALSRPLGDRELIPAPVDGGPDAPPVYP